MGIREDLEKYPCFKYFKSGDKVKILEISPPSSWCFGWQMHHFVERKKLKKYPHLEKHQKLILMPANMNYDIDKRVRPERFKERWGVEINEVVFRGK